VATRLCVVEFPWGPGIPGELAPARLCSDGHRLTRLSLLSKLNQEFDWLDPLD
jgi:hypothetical protein